MRTIHTSWRSPYDQDRLITLGFLDADSGASLCAARMALSIWGGCTPKISLSSAEEIAAAIREIEVPVKLIKTKLADGSEVPVDLEISDLASCRKVIAVLEEKGYICREDRAGLNPYITKMESQLSFMDQLTHTMTLAQRDCIEQFCDPYVEAIVDACRDINDADLLGDCAAWCRYDFSSSKRDLAAAVLIEAAQSGPASLFLEKFGGLKDSCLESGGIIERIYSGAAELESALIQLGLGVPTLPLQRECLMEWIDKKLTETFGPDEGPHTGHLRWPNAEIYQKLRVKLFGDGYSLDPISGGTSGEIVLQPYRAVRDALNGQFGKTVGDSRFFCPKHHWNPVTGSIQGAEARARFRQILQQL